MRKRCPRVSSLAGGVLPSPSWGAVHPLEHSIHLGAGPRPCSVERHSPVIRVPALMASKADSRAPGLPGAATAMGSGRARLHLTGYPESPAAAGDWPWANPKQALGGRRHQLPRTGSLRGASFSACGAPPSPAPRTRSRVHSWAGSTRKPIPETWKES